MLAARSTATPKQAKEPILANAPHGQLTDKIEEMTDKQFIGGEYKVLRQFSGAMGNVFLVKKNSIPYPFVLKSYQTTKPELEAIFLNEAKNWVSFGVHQNIVKAMFAEKIDGQIYVAAEYVQGNEKGENRLSNYIGKNISLPLLIKWAIQFTYGMNHCLGKGMKAHSDIKPDNILIDSDFNLKITDFGLSKSFITENVVGGGTPLYNSPEQILDSTRIDHRSDIYSFGIVLYQLVTGGDYPYLMSSPDIRKVHLTEDVKRLIHPLYPVVKKCMEKDLTKRYQQFQELFNDIVKVAKSEVIEIPKQIISRDDKLEELYILSCSLSAIDEREQALKAIREYIVHQPDHSSAWTQKGRLEFELGNFNEALESTKKSVYLYQYSSQALNNLGAIYLELDNANDARTCLLRAVEIDPDNSGALMNLANALIETGNFEESAQCILRCFELTPSKSSLIANAKNLVSSYVQNRLFELSAKIYSCIEQHSELTVNEAFNFAMCCFTIQDYKSAIIIFKKILQQNPTDKEAEMYLSKCYSMLGEKG